MKRILVDTRHKISDLILDTGCSTSSIKHPASSIKHHVSCLSSLVTRSSFLKKSLSKNFAQAFSKGLYSLLATILCLGISIFLGCGNDDEVVIAPDAEEFISQGWKEYVAGNYEDAIAKYQKALAENSDSSEAYNGIGWSKARLGLIQDAIENFKMAVAKGPSNADAYVGLAGAYLADGDYERAIASADPVMLLYPDYSSHHDDIKAAHVHILLAECYYNVGDYTAARAQIDLLGDSGKRLDPSSPDYLADLLSVIEDLAREGI
jgi:tetratricopeptide (TPR) repeat protein